MLTTQSDIDDFKIQFSLPRYSEEQDIALVYAAICNAKPILLESPKLSVDSSFDLQSDFGVDIQENSKFQQILDNIDEIIRRNILEHNLDMNFHGSTNKGCFKPKLLVDDSTHRQTKFFLPNKKDAELNMNAKTIQKLLKNTQVRLICRLDGYYMNLSQKGARPLWYVEQCLIVDNLVNNPVAKKYHFLDDDIAPYHLDKKSIS